MDNSNRRRSFLHNRSLRAGLLALILLSLFAAIAPALSNDPYQVDLSVTLEPPSSSHLLGTDALGRDVAARIAYGARVSLGVALMTALLSLLIGAPLGVAAGYRGGWIDAIVSRCIESVACIPTLLLAISLLAVSPASLRQLPDVLRVAIVLAFGGWIPVARYLRGEFMRLRSSALVESARASGAGEWRIVVHHLLPAAMAPIWVTAAFAAAAAIMVEAVLSFLGLGVQPPQPTWGGLLSEAREQINSGWWLALTPGLALFLSVWGFNQLGEGLRQWQDPRSTRR